MDRIRTKEFLLRMEIQGLTDERLSCERWNLSWLNLENKNLRLMDLEGVIFKGARLKNADFSSANLRNVDFSYADLRGVKFNLADLRGAKLAFAKVKGADFDKARLGNTDFSEIDFGKIKLIIPKMSIYHPPKIVPPFQTSIWSFYQHLKELYWTVSFYYSRFLVRYHNEDGNK